MELKNDATYLEDVVYKWNVPVEGEEGIIENQMSAKILGLKNNDTASGTEVVWQTKDESISVSQKWLRVKSSGFGFGDQSDWFTLVSSLSGRVLTTSEEQKLIITGTVYFLKKCTPTNVIT